MTDNAEPIQTTTLSEHCVVITHKLDDEFALRPFRTFMRDGSGDVSAVADFTTSAAALQCHDALVRERR